MAGNRADRQATSTTATRIAGVTAKQNKRIRIYNFAAVVLCHRMLRRREILMKQDNIARLSYPPAAQTDHRDVLHGVEVPDPYRWLEDLDSEQTRAWIEAQNRLTAEYLAQIPEREPIRERLTELWNYE